MTFSDFPLVSIVIFLPFAAATFLAMAYKLNIRALYWFSVLIAVINLALAFVLLSPFISNNTPGFKWGEQFTWVKEIGLRYQVSVDSISAWLIVLTAFLGLVAVFAGGG